MEMERTDQSETDRCTCPFCDDALCPIPGADISCCSRERVEIHRLDCVGLYCPVPIMRAKEEIDALEDGAMLEVVADDPAASEDIPRWAKRAGHRLLHSWEENGDLHFLVQKGRKEEEMNG